MVAESAAHSVSISGSTTSPVACARIASDNFREVFCSACRSAWRDIISDDVLKVANSNNGSQVWQLASLLSPDAIDVSCSAIADCFRHAFVDKAMITARERETLMCHIHKIRLSPEVLADFTTFVLGQVPAAQPATTRMLLQVWLRKVAVRMLSELHKLRGPSETNTPDPLSDVDQSVLYYISGFIVNNLKASCRRHSKLERHENLISLLSSTEPQQTGHFVEKYSKWVKTQSRGGLVYPIADFYLLIRDLDLTFRQVVLTKGLAAMSLDKTSMVHAMLASFMVQYYWKRILAVTGSSDCTAQDLLNYVICCFVSIKGFAVAKKEKERLTSDASRKRTGAKSASFRGQLKKK